MNRDETILEVCEMLADHTRMKVVMPAVQRVLHIIAICTICGLGFGGMLTLRIWEDVFGGEEGVFELTIVFLTLLAGATLGSTLGYYVVGPSVSALEPHEELASAVINENLTEKEKSLLVEQVRDFLQGMELSDSVSGLSEVFQNKAAKHAVMRGIQSFFHQKKFEVVYGTDEGTGY